VGLHHHGVEGLVDPAARLEPVREEAALPQLGDSQAEIAHLSGALIRAALMARGTNGRGDLRLQQILETPAHDLRDQGASGGALHELSQLGGATMGEGHGLCSVWW